ncbi:MAG TPA: autotransporter-associated beta strand repeat-containing protein [Chthoniobacterales bacterium]
MTDVSIAEDTTVESIVFTEDASPFAITVNPLTSLTILGSIVNNSGATQEFDLAATPPFNESAVNIANGATIGDRIAFFLGGGALSLFPGASAGNAAITINRNTIGGANITFFGGSSAGNANLTLNPGLLEFNGDATADNSSVTVNGAAEVLFLSTATAANSSFVINGSTRDQFGGNTIFYDNTSAGVASFTLQGGRISGAGGAEMIYQDEATADAATFVVNGGQTAGAIPATITFEDDTMAANATFTINGGVNGGDGGLLQFMNSSDGGTAAFTLSDNGQLDISTHKPPGVSVGSVAGNGLVSLGANQLTIGANNLDATFSGTIQNAGSIAKSGTGTLTLSSANSYTGGTTVTSGTLVVSNTTGSATGTGAVSVNAGTLGGSGIIAGAVTIGTGSGTGAFLVPAAGGKKQLTLTIQSALTFKADATYTYTFKAKQNKARTDKVIANGVTINSGATVNVSGQTQGSLKRGLTLTLISNTSASPISGTFANLPDGGIVNVNGNNLQANYEGGDGNDLTLTVVP